MPTIVSIRSLLLAWGMLAMSAASYAQMGIAVTVGIAPPELPIYEQPLLPEEGYLRTPGDWCWNGGAFQFYDGY